jgi:Cu/Ag efflux protein CusF
MSFTQRVSVLQLEPHFRVDGKAEINNRLKDSFLTMSQTNSSKSMTSNSESVNVGETTGIAQEQSTGPTRTDAPIQAQPSPRKIDETTDINTLTDEEIRHLNEQAVTNAMQVQDERVSFASLRSAWTGFLIFA